jgi:putative endonuclease
MNGYHYVYTLQSVSHPEEHYTGQTQHLKQRLMEHNSGNVPHTSKFLPWVIRSATAFREKRKAIAFERYLKTGCAFLRRHF